MLNRNPFSFICSITILLLADFLEPTWQQSAELEDLQRLCPNVRGTFCAHCSHRSVEQICPMECRFCNGATRGISPQNTHAGAILPRNLGFEMLVTDKCPSGISGVLKQQCTLVKGFYCYTCKISSISELCVDECLACEENGFGRILTDNGLNPNPLEPEVSEPFGLLTGSGREPRNLLDIFQQVQKIELEEKMQKKDMLDDVGAEEEAEEALLEDLNDGDEANGQFVELPYVRPPTNEASNRFLQ